MEYLDGEVKDMDQRVKKLKKDLKKADKDLQKQYSTLVEVRKWIVGQRSEGWVDKVKMP